MKKLIALGSTLLASTAAAQGEVPDVRKFRVEEPVKTGLGLPVFEDLGPSTVAWHADLAAARTAAAESGRPILLFQLLGRLDEEFC